ncbi:MAG: VWA domain-containing protein [Chloroflexia bacterium]|nr:VWA domain-containing protein [Chloroflexia bacterium]
MNGLNLPDIAFIRPWAWWLLMLIPLVVAGGALLARNRRATRWGTALRTATLVLLVVSLTGPLLVQGARQTTTVFVVDRSASIQPGSADAANEWVMSALSSAGADDSAAIVTFGAEPDLTVPATDANAPGDDWLDARPAGETTDLASALTLARALPVGDNRRIVVLSDGAENVGNALEEANSAAADGIRVDVVPLAGIENSDLRVERVEGPAALWQGDDLPLLVSLGSGGGGEAIVDLLVDGEAISSETVTLNPGQTVYSLTAPELEPGFHSVEVRVSATDDIDRIAENNAGFLGVTVREQPGVLLVAPVGSDPARLQQALTDQGAEVTLTAPGDVPVRLSDLGAYDAVVLDNVSAWELSTDQQQALIAHTEAGNGFLVVGGSASYGPGSYAGTPLERAMPVTVKVVDGQRRPSVAVLIVMDKSGSMSYDPQDGDTSKIDLAKDGVVTAASALTEGDQLGVIAFNDEPIWAMPMMTMSGTGDLGQVEDALAALSADGGTELYPALQVGYDNLRNVEADVRHIILLSDGRSRGGTRETYARLVNDLGNDNITLSTVALGTDADLELLEFLSVEGNGRYHFANAPEEIPQITFQEAQNAGSQSVLRGAFSPVQQQASPILNGLDTASMPPIDGYNFAEGRANAQVDLVSDRGDPLLAKWQLGLGRVVAWTADDGSDYASAWSTWDQYDQFWGQALRWSLPDPTNGAITSRVERAGSDAVITIDSQAGDGGSIDLAGQTVAVTLPDGTTEDADLTLVSPGQYEARVTSPAPGAYRLSLADSGTELAGAVQVSPEWLPAADGLSLLESIAGRSGGVVRSLDQAPDGSLFESAQPEARAPGSVRGLWYVPLTLALLFFVVEIAVRQAKLRAPDRAVP